MLILRDSHRQWWTWSHSWDNMPNKKAQWIAWQPPVCLALDPKRHVNHSGCSFCAYNEGLANNSSPNTQGRKPKIFVGPRKKTKKQLDSSPFCPTWLHHGEGTNLYLCGKGTSCTSTTEKNEKKGKKWGGEGVKSLAAVNVVSSFRALISAIWAALS